MLPEACVDEKYPQCVNTHTQICGKPTCLPGKPWSPRGLDSLRKHTLFLSQCGQCVTSAWDQLAEEEEEALGRRFLLSFIANTLLRQTPLCSLTSHLNLRLKQQEVGEEQ